MGEVYVHVARVRGETVDARSDLSSLGVVLDVMVTGPRPFDRRLRFPSTSTSDSVNSANSFAFCSRLAPFVI